MDVTRIEYPGGSHVEPAYDPAWDDLTQLRWKAAVVAHDTGLRVAVRPRQHGEYSIECGNSSGGTYDRQEAWTYLSGISVGARAQKSQVMPPAGGVNPGLPA